MEEKGELISYEEKSEARYIPGLEANRQQVPCKKTVSGTSFPQGVQNYDFSCSGRYGWIPSKSYFRVGIKATMGSAGTDRPVVQDSFAFADNPCAGLYDNVYVRAGGADISSITSFAAQGHQIKARLTKSRAWLHGVGRSAYGMNADFSDRVNAISSNGTSTEEYVNSLVAPISTLNRAATISVANTGVVTGTNTTFLASDVGKTLYAAGRPFEITVVTNETSISVAVPQTVKFTAPIAGTYANSWISSLPTATNESEKANTVYFMYVPPVGIFDADIVLGSGEYRVQLNPNSRYKTAIVQSLTAKTAGTDYDINIQSVEFYPYIVKTDMPATQIEKLFLNEMHLQTKSLSSGQSILDFTVPPSTMAISVFIQAAASGSDTRLPITLFSNLSDADKELTEIQISYANTTKPTTNWTSDYNYTTGINLLQQRYIDVMIDSGLYYSEGGSDSLEEFKKRGLICAHYSFERDAKDRSTNVQLRITFDATATLTNTNAFIVAHYNNVVEITQTDGRVTNVRKLAV